MVVSLVVAVRDEILNALINNANLTMLHPLDWDRFYIFVATCHQTGAKIAPEDVERALLRAHFPADTARALRSVYAHGRRLLRLAPAARARRCSLLPR